MKISSISQVLVLAILAFGCSSTGSNIQSGGDTVYLDSGVKYLVIQEGSGAPVEAGKEVSTNINLMINSLDDTVWSTYGGNQFSFVAKKTSLIRGFDEVVMLLKKGDRIMAVIPPELGYGPQGNGPDIPGNAMLYFDLAIEDVLQPRKPIADLLFQAWQSEGVAGIKACYDTLAPQEDLYKMDDEEWYNLSISLADNKAWEDIVGLWDYRMADSQMIGGYYYKARALDSLNRLDEAIKLMEEAVRMDNNNNPNISGYLESLKARK
jgi:hypothetical protein